MKSIYKNPVLIFAVAGMLALGVAGCSSSHESTSTLETTVTDADGNSKTTTTTSTTADGKTTTETTESTNGDLSYVNDFYSVAYRLPVNYSKGTLEPENSNEEVDYYATDGFDNSVAFVLVSGINNIDGVTDADTWAKAYGDQLQKTLEQKGETNIKCTVDDATIGTTPAKFLHIESESGVDTIYRDFFFVTDSDGDGMRIALTATSETELEALRAGLAGPEA